MTRQVVRDCRRPLRAVGLVGRGEMFGRETSVIETGLLGPKFAT